MFPKPSIIFYLRKDAFYHCWWPMSKWLDNHISRSYLSREKRCAPDIWVQHYHVLRKGKGQCVIVLRYWSLLSSFLPLSPYSIWNQQVKYKHSVANSLLSFSTYVCYRNVTFHRDCSVTLGQGSWGSVLWHYTMPLLGLLQVHSL